MRDMPIIPEKPNTAGKTKHKGLIFAGRNVKEMTRDPVIYIFCIAFPVAMLALFVIINKFADGHTPVFEFTSLLPGVLTFSYSFLMLAVCLLVSKDKTSSLLKRLYTSPMKRTDFVFGYVLPSLAVGIAQTVVTLFSGYIISLIIGSGYIAFGKCVLLALEQLPSLFINISLGIVIGCLLNEKSAPAITSVFISASGILGGAWMPLDTMGSFEVFCRFLPFYPSVYLGRIITGATHTPTDYTNPVPVYYSFDGVGITSVIVLSVYLIVSVILAIIFFGIMMKKDD